MNRWWIACLAVCGLSLAHAQGTYFGIGLSHVFLTAPPQYGLIPLPEVQLGGPVAPEFGGFELRASLGTILLFSNVGFDALASIPLSEGPLRLYLGGGPNLLVFMGGDTLPGQESPQVFFGVHGTVGLELLAEPICPFAELQPAAAFLYSGTVLGLRARAGLNIAF